jgi:hypothetical protein
MRNTNKTLALLLTLIITMPCLTLLTVNPANAQTQKPTAPQFTIKDSDYSHTVQSTYGIDPYTGKSKIVSDSYRMADRQVQFTIPNQQYNRIDSNGNHIQLYYYIRYKGHYGSTWSDNTDYEDDVAEVFRLPKNAFREELLIPANYSAYTNVVVHDPSFSASEEEREGLYYAYLPEEGDVDFQVKALIGTPTLESNGMTGTCFGFYYYTFSGQVGDWSEIQTISIPNGTTTSTPYTNVDSTPTSAATPTPTVPEMPALMILPLFLATVAIALITRHRNG